MTAGPRAKGGRVAFRVLSEKEYAALTPGEKGSYTKWKKRIEAEQQSSTGADQPSSIGTTDRQRRANAKSSGRKRAPSATEIHTALKKKTKSTKSAAPSTQGELQVDEAVDEEESTESNGPATHPPPSDEDSDVEAVERRRVAARGKRPEEAVDIDDDDDYLPVAVEIEEEDDGGASGEDFDGERIPKKMTANQLVQYRSALPNWREAGADAASNVHIVDIDAVVESFGDDADDLRLVAQARERAQTLAATIAPSEPLSAEDRTSGSTISSAGRGRPQPRRVAPTTPSTASGHAAGHRLALASSSQSTMAFTANVSSSGPASAANYTIPIPTTIPNPATASIPATSTAHIVATTPPFVAGSFTAHAATSTTHASPAFGTASSVAIVASNAQGPAAATSIAANQPAATPHAATLSATPSTVPVAGALPAHATSAATPHATTPIATPSTAPAVGALPAHATTYAVASNATAATAATAATVATAAATAPPGPGTWPVDIAAVPATRGHMLLKAQNERVRNVLRRALKTHLPRKMCFDNMYPQPAERHAFLREVVISAAVAAQDNDIVARLRTDNEYVSAMLKIPEARMSNFRGKLKDAADAVVRSAYRIDHFPPARHVHIVKWLVAEQDRLYIFPGDPVASTYNDTRPFCNDGIINVLRSSFFGPRAIATFKEQDYNEGHEEPQLPDAMVAAAAAAVEAALRAYLMGREPVHIDFSGNQFIRAYLDHVSTLRQLRFDHRMAYDAVMEELYRVAAGVGNQAGPVAGNLAGGTANPNINVLQVAEAFGIVNEVVNP
ncbi:hypothetical protein FA95DRAFT_1578462 [Auriscalpium vulgare]|uniref:Uncharacterized protein n=1 Tax=Auriscalpium vulgare TaxID=40419 RepID=A0ACB8R1M1_9AGAM|nr:hypothetical protein FA95DRAFT_1578462 [Auriscalpium vulgare]